MSEAAIVVILYNIQIFMRTNIAGQNRTFVSETSLLATNTMDSDTTAWLDVEQIQYVEPMLF